MSPFHGGDRSVLSGRPASSTVLMAGARPCSQPKSTPPWVARGPSEEVFEICQALVARRTRKTCRPSLTRTDYQQSAAPAAFSLKTRQRPAAGSGEPEMLARREGGQTARE